jgi:hypothetical protein
MKKIGILLAVLAVFALGAGVFASDLFSEDRARLINDELVPLGNSQAAYTIASIDRTQNVVRSTTTQAGTLEIDESSVNQGIVAVKLDHNGQNKIKISLKLGEQQVYYNYLKPGEYETFPLVFGNGFYEVAVLENTTGNSYKVLEKMNVTVKLNDENLPFLHSVQPVRWTLEDESSQLASDLTRGLQTDSEKFMAIYRYVAENLQYDHDKIDGLDYSYVPVNQNTLESQGGICYDYASLMASMLRSVGIPTKLVKGYGDFQPEVYHAWNEVLLNGQWILVDATYDSQQLDNGRGVDVVKDSSTYQIVSVY